MSKEPSRFSAVRPLVSRVVVLISVYVRRPDFRSFVDAKFAWVKENAGKYAPRLGGNPVETPAATPEPGSDSAQPPRPSAAGEPGVSAPLPEPKPGVFSEAGKPAFDLQRVCADPTLWPKTVVLKRNVYFPAVLDGKTIGTLRAPKGSEARLVTIRSGKLGLEYRGGGAWLDPGGTDFEERARLAFH